MKIKSTYKVIKRNIINFFKQPSFRSRFYFAKHFGKINIDEKCIFFESYSGNNFSGNVFYIYKEIIQNKFFDDYKKFIGVQKKNRNDVEFFLKSQNIQDYILVDVNSKKYCQALLSSQYLFNNSTLPFYYIKNPHQILVNTWHGTPLKTLGKKVNGSAHEIGNTQRNYLMCDYLMLPNEFTLKHLREDFMLDNMYKGKYILDGYPRNYNFYKYENIQFLKKKLGLEEKEIICYMPTWRGAIDDKDNERQVNELRSYLKYIDKTLNSKKIMFINLHNFVKNQINLSEYKYIKAFPKSVETYEFLSISDCLVTDYSSVFFDYANLNKKIVLFAYDKDEYLASRGLYFPMEELPFSIVYTVEELAAEFNDLNTSIDYSDFINKFCPYDYRNSAKDIVDIVMFNHTSEVKIIDANDFCNSKPNVLIYAGSLAKNGLTTSLKGLINHINLDDYNYTLLFYRGAVRRHNQEINAFPNKIKYIPIQGKRDITIQESFAQLLYYRFNCKFDWIYNCLKSMYEREIKRIFPSLCFDYVIHFTGYEKQIVHLFNNIDHAKKIIYVHSNMKKEMETRSNYHIPSLFKAYHDYDLIAGVREGIDDELVELLPSLNKDKIKIVHNVNNIDVIINNANKPVSFEEDTESTHTLNEIEEILSIEGAIRFINIARFSPEKGLLQLIKAFEKFYSQHEQSYLFIVGGHGTEYEEILDYVLTRNLRHIIVIKSMSNPFSILKKCDYFILSSLYEGLPMSIMEALILDKPVICTNIDGPRKFLEQGYGYIVDNSVAGLVKGMKDAFDGEIKLKKFDADEFNEKALQEFYDIFLS